MLETDDSVVCQSKAHGILQIASLVVICLVSCGLPLAFGYVLIKAARVYEREIRPRNIETAQLLATAMNADVVVAEYCIRDLTIGRGYSFIMDAYVPWFLYCPGPPGVFKRPQRFPQ